jgi:hypothetical protein
MSTRKPFYQRTFLAILVCGLLYLVVLYVILMILFGAGMKELRPILIIQLTSGAKKRKEQYHEKDT